MSEAGMDKKTAQISAIPGETRDLVSATNLCVTSFENWHKSRVLSKASLQVNTKNAKS